MEKKILTYRGLPINGRYEIYENGDIINVKRGTKIKPFPDGRRGYMKVRLYYDNEEGGKVKDVTATVHRLVMENFLPLKDYTDMEVDHINKKVTDNRLSNLRWVTKQENANHKNPFYTHRRDIRNVYILVLKMYFKFGHSVNFIAKKLKLDAQTVSNFVNGKIYTELKIEWYKFEGKHITERVPRKVVRGSTTRVSLPRIDMPKELKYVQTELRNPIHLVYPFLEKPRGRFKKPIFRPANKYLKKDKDGEE